MADIYKIDKTFDGSHFSGASCAFGVFDGVHAGHQHLIDCACETARSSGGKAVVLTFDIDPDEVFHAERLKKLMTNERRINTLAGTGADVVVVLPFTRRFAALEPDAFLKKTFNGAPPAFLHIGCDFRFGAKAAGTTADLAAWGASSGMQVVTHDLVSVEGKPITATRIRLLLADGKVEEANRLLCKPYLLEGVVEPGRGEGSDFGFRTANLHVADQLRPIGDGVYAAWASVDGIRYKAAVNVGVPATFADRATATCEVHLLDFEGDLYGKSVAVEFMNWLRPMRKFDDVQELIATVQGNIDWVRKNL